MSDMVRSVAREVNQDRNKVFTRAGVVGLVKLSTFGYGALLISMSIQSPFERPAKAILLR